MKHETISGRFYATANRLPGKPALILGDHTMTYAGLLDAVQLQTAIFRAQNLQRGSHLLLKLANPIDFVVAYLAAADAGIVLVPLNPKLPEEATNAAAITTDSAYLIDHGFEQADHTHSMRLKFAGKDDDLFLLITTSGSTGHPKPIMLKQGTKIRRTDALIDLYGLTEADVTLVSTPIYHSMAMRLILASVFTGGTLVFMEKWLPAEWCRLVYVRQVTFAIPVAQQWKQIAGISAGVSPDYMRSLRCVMSSSAFLPSDVMDTLDGWLPVKMQNCYGTTEVAIATSGTAECGVAAPGVDIRIGQDNEIQVRTPLLFDGYYNLPEPTELCVDEGYFKTGDVGALFDQTVLIIHGRIKEVINVGGTAIYPQDIEEVVSSHPGILECAAFPAPSAEFGEVVALAYVMKDGKELDEHGILMHVFGALTDEQLPRVFRRMDALPKTDSGKIRRFKLVEMLRDENI